MARKKRRGALRIAHDLFLPHDGNKRRPHLLRANAVLGVLALVICLEIGMLSQVFVFSRVQWMIASVLPGVITALTNEARADEALPPLSQNAILAAAAQDKAEDMAARGYFSHESPDGVLPWYWFDAHGYKYKYAGENLAIDFTDSDAVVDAWLASPTHRANIVKGGYTEIGIGMATGTYQGRETIFVVQFFGSPRSSGVARAAVPEPTPIQGAAAEAEDTNVLGAAVISKEEGRAIGTLDRILASPRTFGTYTFAGLALFFSLLLVLGFLPVAQRMPHPSAVVNGGMLAALLLGIMVLNQGAMHDAQVATIDSQHAAVVSALE